MKNERIGLSDLDFDDIRQIAAEYQVEEYPYRERKRDGGYYPFHRRDKTWVFVIDFHWNKRWLRFNKAFIPQLEQAGLVVAKEAGAGRNCSVRYQDFRQALRLCT